MYSNTLHQLQGCVNDSKYMESNLLAAGWPSANIKRLNDSQATKNAIRRAISNVSAKAVSGDTFVFMQSSHGGHPQTILTGNSGKAVYLCVYDENPNNDTTAYNDYELAKDLASFRSGVKVVVIVDACHAAGLFKSAAKAKSNPASFDIADRVSTLMDADRDAHKTRGEKSAKGLSSSEIGWATAADYYEESSDKGFYHTDRWLTYGPDGNYYDPYSYKPGGAFLASATWGMWNGTADKNSTVGNRDGYCDAYEFWKSGYDACVRWWNYHPQCRNTNVLRSVKLGKSGSSLTLGASNRSFPAAAVTGKELAVAASVGWTAKSSVSWLTLKTASGTGNGKIVYNVAANTGSGTRTGKITVTGNGGKSATFTVTQGGKKSKSVAKAATAAGRVWVTTSDGQPGDAVADGNEETGWTPEGTGGAWVALTFEEARCVGSVVVKGKSLPEGMRVLVSEDGDDWSEEGSEAASYLWVVLPDEGTKPTITEIESEP